MRKPRQAVCEICQKEFWHTNLTQRRCSRECFAKWSVAQRLSQSEDKFWKRVIKTEGCWEWDGNPATKGGYCRFNKTLAHRASWEFTYGAIPEGLQVCHKCDNPKCVRPDHLFLGTQRDNVRDMHQKGRARRNPLKGERCYMAKLKDQEVSEIRSLFREGLRLQELAERFGVSKPQVCRIVNNKSRAA